MRLIHPPSYLDACSTSITGGQYSEDSGYDPRPWLARGGGFLLMEARYGKA
jgi:hypothetical protein